ncbi:uncharacterized protein LOC104907471 isoform X3 [Beta vulgaris subsp. vulgaris]|nr:uncharacterized protein LOC104907471 isoform X3 [Beta vulgaris subsp. vulgaris]
MTCTECSSARFLASYSDWFSVLLSHIQASGASQFVRVASFAAVSDLLTRLGGFSNVKKDGTSHAGKLVHPILKMFNEDATQAVLDVAAHLLLTILNNFPSSVLRHHDNVEGVILSKIMSANCSSNLLKKLSCCLASLPKSRGDEDSWSLMMQKVLLSLSSLLNSTLEGLEEETRRVEVATLLVPPGTNPPPSLGGIFTTEEALKNGERSQKSLISSISSLMQCCCTMLTDSYPVQVTIPVRPLLALIRRVLMVNGSLPETLQPFTTTMQQEFVCLQLPVLHLSVLEVLGTVVKGCRSQLLPHAADVVWLLMKYFKTCWLPELRTKVYSIIRGLLISMGAGIALYISEEVVDNGTVDLKFGDSNHDGTSSDEPSCVDVSLQHRRKKRKHGAATGLLVEQQASLSLEPKECQASIALKRAAIETLEALLVVGGALRCDAWRRRIDDLMIEVATNACSGGWTHDDKLFHCKETRGAWEGFQLVALRALLASLLSPAGYRSPYLSKGLELFHKGKQNTGTKVAEFCAQALLALEVLVHPRALSLIDMSLPNGSCYSSGMIDFGGPKHKVPHKDSTLSTGHGNSHDVYDFLNDIYMEDDPGSEVLAGEVCKDVQFDENLQDVSRDQNDEDPNAVSGLPDEMVSKERNEGSEPTNFDKRIKSKDSVMMDVQQHEEPMSNTLSAKKGIEENILNECASDMLSLTPVSGQSISAAKGIASTTGVDADVTTHADNKTWMNSTIQQDDESSDLFPDIVDGDPDTDSDSE